MLPGIREVLAALYPDRAAVILSGITAALGLVCCALPLLNLLGYESGATIGAVSGLLALWSTSRWMAQGDHHPLVARGGDPPWMWWLGLSGRHVVTLTLPPTLILSLNALRVLNCDLGLGWLFWAVIPVISVAIGQTVAWVLGVWVRSHRRRVVLGFTLVVLNALAFGLHIALEPPITGHQWLIGYFSGSIYDEALGLPRSLVVYRVMNLATIVAILAGLECWRLRRAVLRGPLVVAIWSAAVMTGLWWTRHEHGIDITREVIARELGGRLETEHFVIYYPAREPYLSQLKLLAEDHEFRYAEQRAYLGTDPVAHHNGAKVRSFVYGGREQKGRLMGARNTLIAKIWLREMHITWDGYGDHLLAHELAHIFTEPFGAGPFRVSVQNGLGVNMGLVEGIATAADWQPGELSPHMASAAMRRLKIAPDIRGLVGASGFWSQASGRAYTLMGSFVRFLVDRYGIERFRRAYPFGDLEGAYGKRAAALVSEWEGFVDALPVDERAMDLARYRYSRPSIFGKVCARTIAEERRLAQLAVGRGDVIEAQRRYDRIAQFAPKHVGYQLERARLLARLEDLEPARRVVQALDARELSPVQRAQVEQLRGDLLWRAGDPESARAVYEQCARAGVPDATRRLLTVKAQTTSRDARARELGRRYLLESTPASIAMVFPLEWARLHPDDPLASYLIGRKLWGARQWAESLAWLERAHGRLPDALLNAETARMLAQSLMHTGDYTRARQLFEALAQGGPPRLQTEASEWLARVDFAARYRAARQE